MRPLQARLVTLCQQVLALGVVLVVLTPASGVVSLDIVGEAPGAPAAAPAAPAALMSATVPTKAVTPTVTEVPLTGAAGGFAGLRGRTVAGGATEARVVSTPQPVDALRRGRRDLAAAARSSRRTRSPSGSAPAPATSGAPGRTWSTTTSTDPTRTAPRPRTPAPAPSRRSSATSTTSRSRPAPTASPCPTTSPSPWSTRGRPRASETEAPADTADDGPQRVVRRRLRAAGRHRRRGPRASPCRPRGKQTVAQPTIYSRAQWGADESIRNKSALRYGTISGGFVHHTVNANDYTEAQVPALLRSIYAYHVKSRGWSDIGYNFLVDRFGRIWEGRYGGIDKPVVGAHTLNYNDYSFAMSAIGNFDTVQPPDVMLRAYGQLFAWKLSLHGVNPASTSQKIGRRHVPGDQRPPRRRLDGLPGQVPLRPAAADPDVRLPGGAGGPAAAADRGARSPSPPRRTTSTPRPTRTSSCGAPPTAAAWCCRPVA